MESLDNIDMESMLESAILCDDLEMTMKMVSKLHDHKIGSKALITCVENKKIVIARLLLEAGCNPFVSCYFGPAPLEWSVMLDQWEMFRLFISQIPRCMECGVPCSKPREQCCSSRVHSKWNNSVMVNAMNQALFNASYLHRLRFLNVLLHVGASPKANFFVKGEMDVYCASPLVAAIFHRSEQCSTSNSVVCKIMVKLLEHGADVNSHNSLDNTALHWTVEKSLFEISSYLLKHGADVNARNHKGHTPLMLLCRHQDCDGNRQNIARILLNDPSVDLELTDKEGHTALHCLSMRPRGSVKVAGMLLERGACPDGCPDPYRHTGTPLYCALHAGHTPLVWLLVQWGADVNHPVFTSMDTSLFAVACSKRNVDYATLLLRAGTQRDTVLKNLDSLLNHSPQDEKFQRMRPAWEWMREQAFLPPSLLHTCRLAVRAAMARVPLGVCQLPVPTKIQAFLSFES